MGLTSNGSFEWGQFTGEFKVQQGLSEQLWEHIKVRLDNGKTLQCIQDLELLACQQQLCCFDFRIHLLA